MTVYYKNLALDTSEDVYVPAEDSFLLAGSLKVEGGRVLDVGTGTGIVALAAAGKADYVLGVDVNPEAVELARGNAQANGILNAEFRLSDLFSSIGVKEKFGLIAFNPPYLPVKEDGLLERSWSGGRGGLEVIECFLGQADRHLTPDGRILMVVSSLNNLDELEEMLRRNGLSYAIVAEERIPFETLYVICSKVCSKTYD